MLKSIILIVVQYVAAVVGACDNEVRTVSLNMKHQHGIWIYRVPTNIRGVGRSVTIHAHILVQDLVLNSSMFVAVTQMPLLEPLPV